VSFVCFVVKKATTNKCAFVFFIQIIYSLCIKSIQLNNRQQQPTFAFSVGHDVLEAHNVLVLKLSQNFNLANRSDREL
jgi:hypothetical protein